MYIIIKCKTKLKITLKKSNIFWYILTMSLRGPSKGVRIEEVEDEKAPLKSEKDELSENDRAIQKQFEELGKKLNEASKLCDDLAAEEVTLNQKMLKAERDRVKALAELSNFRIQVLSSVNANLTDEVNKLKGK